MTLKKQFLILIFIQLIFGLLIQSYYFLNLNNLLIKRQKEYIQSNEDQIVSVIDNKYKAIKNMGETLVLNTLHQEYINEKDPFKKSILAKHIQRNISEIIERNNDVTDIKILSSTGKILIDKTIRSRFIIYDVIQDYPLDKFNSYGLTTFYKDDFIPQLKQNNIYFFYISPIYSTTKYSGKALGYLAISISMDNINNYLTNGVEYFITDNKGFIGASTNTEFLAKDINHLKKNKDLKVRYIHDLNWTIYSDSSIARIKTDIKPIISNGLILLSVTFILITLSSLVIMKNITNPIKDIICNLRDISSNKNNQLNSVSNNEIEIITKEINDMLNKLEKSNNRILHQRESLLIEKMEKKKAQFKALQSQINPHFLYNTLETIRMMSLTDSRKDVAKAIKILANLFRYTTQNERNKVSIKEEIDHVYNYTELLKIRYEDNINIFFELDKTLYDNEILKFILQPIVENAFEHGLEHNKGVIKIILTKSNNNILFKVVDDGPGIAESILTEMSYNLINDLKPKSESVGLYNVNTRIKLNYGRKYGIFIDSKLNKGTSVSILFPSEG